MQANCQWGRDTIESWGRKRRETEATESGEEDMNISQEILVLDFGDEDTKFSNRQTASLPANFPNNSNTNNQSSYFKKIILTLFITNRYLHYS